MQSSLINSPIMFKENHNSQYRLWTRVSFYCTSAKFSWITRKVCTGSVYFSVFLFPTMSSAGICVLCYRMSILSYARTSQLSWAVWQMQLSKKSNLCAQENGRKDTCSFSTQRVWCQWQENRWQNQTSWQMHTVKKKMLFFCVCMRSNFDVCLWNASMTCTGIAWNRQYRVQCWRAAAWQHKMLTARSQISQVFWNMVLCPLTVADILEELAVSIFSHLLTMHHTEQFNLCDGDCFFQFLHE